MCRSPTPKPNRCHRRALNNFQWNDTGAPCEGCLAVAFLRLMRLGKIFMLGFSRWQLFKGFAAAVGIVSIVSLVLMYFFPAPPSKVIMATAFKGSAFEY